MLIVLLPAAALAASAQPGRHALFASLPSQEYEVRAPSWLLAATGKCTHQQYTEHADGDAKYIARVAFTFMPSTTMQFTDAPDREAFEIASTGDQVKELASADWNYKNVALLEPDGGGTDWAISTFAIEEHGLSEGGGEVHYSGNVTSRSSNFPGVRTDTFPCQLFVDTAESIGGYGDKCFGVTTAELMAALQVSPYFPTLSRACNPAKDISCICEKGLYCHMDRPPYGDFSTCCKCVKRWWKEVCDPSPCEEEDPSVGVIVCKGVYGGDSEEVMGACRIQV